jgi:hypothetical protein
VRSGRAAIRSPGTQSGPAELAGRDSVHEEATGQVTDGSLTDAETLGQLGEEGDGWRKPARKASTRRGLEQGVSRATMGEPDVRRKAVRARDLSDLGKKAVATPAPQRMRGIRPQNRQWHPEVYRTVPTAKTPTRFGCEIKAGKPIRTVADHRGKSLNAGRRRLATLRPGAIRLSRFPADGPSSGPNFRGKRLQGGPVRYPGPRIALRRACYLLISGRFRASGRGTAGVPSSSRAGGSGLGPTANTRGTDSVPLKE